MRESESITAVAVSGGVDSLYALVSLREQGEHVIALHARMLPPPLAPAGYGESLARLKDVCFRLGVPLSVIDCVEPFARLVIDPFVRSYAAGMTPNPCAHCNAAVKFGLLLDAADGLGADRIATGHYVRLEHTPSGDAALYAGKDAAKDQSYFLALVPEERLRRAISPLADKSKPAIREYLAARGIVTPVPAESQEICFVPGDDYRAFLEARAAQTGISLPGPGPVILPDGKRIGAHAGLWRYTEGQRRGLGIAWTEPLYVLEKCAAANTLVAGGADSLGGGEVRAEGWNFLVPFAAWPETVFIRTRFRQTPRPAHARMTENGGVIVREDGSGGGPYARGQIAVAYDANRRVLGGGVII